MLFFSAGSVWLGGQPANIPDPYSFPRVGSGGGDHTGSSAASGIHLTARSQPFTSAEIGPLALVDWGQTQHTVDHTFAIDYAPQTIGVIIQLECSERSEMGHKPCKAVVRKPAPGSDHPLSSRGVHARGAGAGRRVRPQRRSPAHGRRCPEGQVWRC